MARPSRLLAAPVALALLLLPSGLAQAAPAAVERTVLVADCGHPVRVHAAHAAGRVRGFAGLDDEGCDRRVVFVEGGSQGWRSTTTPYRGHVVGVAADDQATYLLYVPAVSTGGVRGLAVTKRTHDGRYWPSTPLSRTVAEAYPVYADLAAHGGRWWAVWTEFQDLGDEGLQAAVHQAGTGAAPRAMTTGEGVLDIEPSVALDARGAVVAWTRYAGRSSASTSDVWVAVADAPTAAWRRARPLLTDGARNGSPDVARAGAVTVVGAVRDGRALAADDRSGTFRAHVFGGPGEQPRVGLSAGSLLAAWEVPGPDGSRVRVARSPGGGAWSGTDVAGAPAYLEALVATGGRATVLVTAGRRVLSRTVAP